MGYGEDRGRAGWYLNEPGGCRHAPTSDDDGLVMYATLWGPIVAYNDDGSVGGIVDAKLMFEMAQAGGARDHLEKPEDW